MTRRSRWFICGCALALAALPPRTARADIIFSNFGSGGAFNTGAGNPIGFDFFTGDNDAQGDSFVPGAAVALNSLTLALASFNRTNSAPLTVSIAASSGVLRAERDGAAVSLPRRRRGAQLRRQRPDSPRRTVRRHLDSAGGG